MADKEHMFKHWNSLTKTCYKQGMICDGCPNKYLCDIEPWNRNPYRMKNIKYAVLRTLRNIGEPE